MLAINVFAMRHLDYIDGQYMPENLVENAVITDPNAVGVLGGG
jgi:hypothetical protein